MKRYALELTYEEVRELKFALNLAIGNRTTMIETFKDEDQFKYIVDEQKEYLQQDKELLQLVLNLKNRLDKE